MSKRNNYISWDEYFMGIALLSAQRSKDPSTQVGACIVNPRNKIISVGYNGMPTGISDDEFPWVREGAPLETKYPYVCHAELNAILNNIGISLETAKSMSRSFPAMNVARPSSSQESAKSSTSRISTRKPMRSRHPSA